jgi:nucleoid DNA-binding protein
VPRLGKFEMVWSKERICKNPQKDYEPILVPKKRQLKLRVIRSLKNM